MLYEMWGGVGYREMGETEGEGTVVESEVLKMCTVGNSVEM